MKLVVAVLGALVTAACAHPAPPAASPAQSPVAFAIVTWNMHAGRGDLTALVSDLSSGRLAGMPVSEYVLLLQEAIQGGELRAIHAPTDVEDFARAHMLYSFYSPVRPTRAGISGNALLATRPLIAPRAIDLPRVRQPRGAIVSSIEIDGIRLFVLNAHLENRVSWLRGGLLSDRARGQQVDALLQMVPSSGPAIVGGDLNTWLGASEPAWRRLAARFPDTREPVEPTFRDRLTLDHLFFDLPPGWTATQLVARNGYGSDHRPVVALVVSASGSHHAP